MSAQRLYKAEWVDREPDGDWDHEIDAWVTESPEPAGWREYALERWPDGPREGEHWPNGYKPFFWPATDKVFRSRSAAQHRVDIINRWGGRAVVVECTPHWETVSAANARRKRERIKQRIARKTVELEALQDAFEAVVPSD